MSKKKQTEKLSFTKIYVIFSMACFMLTLIEIPILQLLSVDVENFATQQIITTGINVAGSFTVYGWKERIFNITRLKMELVKWQWEFKESHRLNPEQFEEIKEQTNGISDAIDEKIDSVITDTINEDVSIGNDI